MPATETTWRNTSRLHQIFAITGVLLTIGTVWMFWKDHARSWKTYQVQTLDIDQKINEMRQQQYETGDAVLEHDRRSLEVSAAKAQPVDAALLERFKSQATSLDQVVGQWKGYGYP